MTNLSTFISKRIKSTDGMSVMKLAEGCKISKATFYRYLADPSSFSDEQLEVIAHLLQLDEQEKKFLLEHRKHGSKDSPVVNYDKDEIYESIKDIILGKVSVASPFGFSAFTIYNANDQGADIVVLSAKKLAQKLLCDVNHMQAADSSHFEVHVFNSYEQKQAQPLYEFLYHLSQTSGLSKENIFSFNHVINNYGMTDADELKVLTRLYHFSSLGVFGNYTIRYADLANAPFGNLSCCLLRYVSKDTSNKYLFLHFRSSGEADGYFFADENLYAFLIHKFGTLQNNFNAVPVTFSATLTINAEIAKCNKYFKKAFVSFYPCFDNFVPELWETAKKRALADTTSLSRIREEADPLQQYKYQNDTEFMDLLLATFIERFRYSEGNEVINLISANGLREFAETGLTAEIVPTGFKFSKPEICKELLYIKSRLGLASKSKQQSYYLIYPRHSIPDVGMCIYKDAQLDIFFHTHQPNAHWARLNEAKIASLFYSYVVNVIIQESNRGGFDSILMSDEEATAFIDNLIETAGCRIPGDDNLLLD